MNFSQRFDIRIDSEEAQRRFMNRIENTVFYEIYYDREDDERAETERQIAMKLGERYDSETSLDDLTENDFYKYLQAIEIFYDMVGEDTKTEITRFVKQVLEESEINLGIQWHNGVFTRKGAKLLDENLVNEPLHWLSDSGYDNVKKPFEKSLGHFLESAKKPELLSDAITDAYEALEALTKIICGNKKDLAGNRETAQLFESVIAARIGFGDLQKLINEYKKVAPQATSLDRRLSIYSKAFH